MTSGRTPVIHNKEDMEAWNKIRPNTKYTDLSELLKEKAETIRKWKVIPLKYVDQISTEYKIPKSLLLPSIFSTEGE